MPARKISYPDKAVRIVVPFAAGGSTDVVARILAEKLQEQFKQPFVVDNRAGASGNIGAELVAKSPADGYTLLMGATGILSINDHLYGKLNYNAAKDFVPVSYATQNANILVVSPGMPATNVADLVQLAKTRPGALSFASSGPGSSTHLSGELFKSMTGVNMLHVPYKGSSQALTDLLGGNVTMLFDNAPSSIGFVQQEQAQGAGRDQPQAPCRACPMCRRSTKPASRATNRCRGVGSWRQPPRRAPSCSSSTVRSMRS